MAILRSLPRLALLFSLALAVYFVAVMFAAQQGLVDRLYAFAKLTIAYGLVLAGIAGVLALVALAVALLVKPRRGWLAALVALAVPLAFFGGLNALRAQAQSVPFIYDLTTDTADPPVFSARIMAERKADNANPMIAFAEPLASQAKWKDNKDVGSKTAAQLIASGYPALKPMHVADSPADVLRAVEDAMKVRGFEGVTRDDKAGTVEGTSVVFWYGFHDDVVARVRPEGDGARLDFRSTSRVGTSDLGVNAKRIADLMEAVRERTAKGEAK